MQFIGRSSTLSAAAHERQGRGRGRSRPAFAGGYSPASRIVQNGEAPAALPSWPSCLGGAAISSCARGRRARPDARVHAGGAAAALRWGSRPQRLLGVAAEELSSRARSGPPGWLCLAVPSSPNHVPPREVHQAAVGPAPFHPARRR